MSGYQYRMLATHGLNKKRSFLKHAITTLFVRMRPFFLSQYSVKRAYRGAIETLDQFLCQSKTDSKRQLQSPEGMCKDLGLATQNRKINFLKAVIEQHMVYYVFPWGEYVVVYP